MLQMKASKQIIMSKSIVFILLISFIFINCGNKKSVNYVFTNNYEGWAALVTNCLDGEKITKNRHLDGETIIFPKSGILLGNFPQPDGNENNSFLMKTDSGYFNLIDKDLTNKTNPKLCSISASIGNEINKSYYSSEYISDNNLKGEDEMLHYDVIYFYVGRNCDINGESFNFFSKKLKEYLVKENVKIISKIP